MKKLAGVLLITIFCCTVASSQQAKPQWITIKSANLRCWECREQLDRYLLKEKDNTDNGIIQWKINLLQGEVRVQFIPDRTTAGAIKAALNNAGFDADDAKAEPDAYKKLPQSCKRAEDGGDPLKGKPCHVQPIN
ncbi:MAG: hypothetical protein NVS3B15_16790 [Sediminibacterium sp.]